MRPGTEPPLICTPEERLDLFARAGFDECFFVKFDERIATLSPARVSRSAGRSARARAAWWSAIDLSLRPPARRRRRAHGASTSTPRGVAVVAVDRVRERRRAGLQHAHSRPDSSRATWPRADRLLGGTGYEIRGPVELGAGRGHALGFPTANVRVPAKLLPKDGVYSATARYDGRDYAALVSIGTNPQFDGKRRTVEAWLRDFQHTIYGRELRLRDLRYVREQRLFAGVDELVEQMQRDLASSRLSQLWLRSCELRPVVLACALAACVRAGSARVRRAPRKVAHVGEPAPDWTEPSLPGPTLSLAVFHGKAVYLNFFATWCPPCNEEAPAIDALAREYAARGLQVVGVDVLENARKAAEFRQEHHLTYPVVVDGGTLRDQYTVNGLPVHVFIDRLGIVRRIVVGEMSPADMRSNAERLLQ